MARIYTLTEIDSSGHTRLSYMMASAVMYSLIETCSPLDIDTRANFREALARAIENPGTVDTPAMYLADLNA